MIKVEQIKKQLEALAQFNATPGVGVTRMAFTPEERQARDYLRREMEAVGLEVYTDAAGNMFGRREGTDSMAAPVMIGSHLDTVRHGGAFDGAAGVVVALEVARVMQERKLATTHPVEVVVLTEEEGGRFGAGLYGSRAMVSDLSVELDKTDADGITQRQAMQDFGFDPERIGEAVRKPGSIKAFLELHIEQGPVLEKKRTSLGIVETIVGIRTISVTIHGRADHAGTTPMEMRRDALVGASKVIVAINEIARTIGNQTVATVGTIDLKPGAFNVVPAQVEFTVDLRAPAEGLLVKATEKMERMLGQVCGELGLEYVWDQRLGVSPVTTDKEIVELITEIAVAKGFSSRKMVSGAGHDAMVMAQLCPIGLLFVPSREGKAIAPRSGQITLILLAGQRSIWKRCWRWRNRIAVME